MKLNERAILVKLSISQFGIKKLDKRITKEIEDTYKTKKAGKFDKFIIAEEATDKIEKIAGRARTYFYKQTLPWEDDGIRVLPTKSYFDFVKSMSSFKENFETEVKNLVDNYPSLIEEAEKRLNKMFNPMDYPRNIQAKFAFNLTLTPLSSSDFRLENLSDKEIEEIKNEVETRFSEAQNKAMNDLWDRIYKVVIHMYEKLSEPDAQFKNSLVNNAVELVEILPKLNIINDPDLDKMTKEIDKKLCNIDIQDLRDNTTIREETAKSAKEILAKLDKFLG